MISAPAVSLTHTSVRFGSQVVLEDISLNLATRTMLALIGPNAGGKTTLLRVILGQVEPFQGEVRVLGMAPSELGTQRTRLGYVAQRALVNQQYPITTREVVRMGAIPAAGLFRRVPAGVDERVAEMLDRVGLTAAADHNFHTLSGGQQQRAMIARALVPQPELLLLDEPTSGLDTAGQTQVWELLQALRRELGLAILIVSHDIGELVPYVDRVACLNRTLHWHDEAELLNEEVLREVYACELDAYFLQHRAHQESFHPGEGHTHSHVERGP